MQALVALCAAALQPKKIYLGAVSKHLAHLRRRVAFHRTRRWLWLLRSLRENLLSDADEGEEEADAATFDEIVERVKEEYKRDARRTIEEQRAIMETERAIVQQTSRTEFDALAENAREARQAVEEAQQKLFDVQETIRRSSKSRARAIKLVLSFSALVLLCLAAGYELATQEFPHSLLGICILAAM